MRGSAIPSRFFKTLRDSGIDIVRERTFADHHPYSESEIEALIAEARREGLTPVTTEKDLVRLRAGGEFPPRLREIVPFGVTLEFDDAAPLRKLLADRLFQAREKRFRR